MILPKIFSCVIKETIYLLQSILKILFEKSFNLE